MRNFFNLLILAVCAFSFANAQLRTPAASPSCKTTQMVGLTEVTLDYSRPSVKDREVYGNLVPADNWWRTGANSATKIGFSTDVTLGGKALKAGEYAILSKVTPTSWDLHLFAWEGGSWGAYREKEAAAVVPMKVEELPSPAESFIIHFDNLRNGSADLFMMWGSKFAMAQLAVPTDDLVQKSIDATMNGPSGPQYYTAASYYMDEGKELGKALEWINMAVDKGYDRFWVLKKKSEIQAASGDKAGAVETAKKSLEKATEAGNEDYIKMNKDNIAKWSM